MHAYGTLVLIIALPCNFGRLTLKKKRVEDAFRLVLHEGRKASSKQELAKNNGVHIRAWSNKGNSTNTGDAESSLPLFLSPEDRIKGSLWLEATKPLSYIADLERNGILKGNMPMSMNELTFHSQKIS